MKRTAVILSSLSLAALVMAAQALAAPPPKATGDVTADSGTQTFLAQFNAQGTLTDAKGSYRVEFTSGSLAGQFYEGEVTCYVQSGNRGILGGPVTDTNNSEITFVRITVIDNGEGSNASGPDQIQVQRFGTPPPPLSQCNAGTTPGTVVEGNLQVHEPK
jgi:hypothetical protein